MHLLRALALVLMLAASTLGGGGAIAQFEVPTVSAEALNAPADAEDAGLQVRSFAEAYNLLLDNYVQPLDTPALLNRAWAQLATEANGKAAAPGPPPAFAGDRATQLDKMRSALSASVRQPNASPERF